MATLNNAFSGLVFARQVCLGAAESCLPRIALQAEAVLGNARALGLFAKFVGFICATSGYALLPPPIHIAAKTLSLFLLAQCLHHHEVPELGRSLISRGVEDTYPGVQDRLSCHSRPW